MLEERYESSRAGTVEQSPWRVWPPNQGARGPLLSLSVKQPRRAELLAMLILVCERLHLTLWDPAARQMLVVPR